jgi:hypothetical protein
LGGGSIVALLAAELGVRGLGIDCGWLDDLAYRQDADARIHAPSDEPELLYTLAASASATFAPREDPDGPSRDVRINALGHRGPDVDLDPSPGVLRILALGGSNTYGAAVSEGETWPAYLQEELRGRGASVEVWNLGVSGYETRQKVAQARHALAHYQPDVLLFQLHNVGPRYILTADPACRWLSNEDLLAEWLPEGFPPSFRRSALVRLFTLLKARQTRSDVEDPLEAVDVAPFEARGRAALTEFLAELPPDVQAVGFVPPAGFASGAPPNALPDAASTGLPLFVLNSEDRPGVRPLPALDGLMNIHPPAPVYALYAERIADALMGPGCSTASFRRGSTCVPSLVAAREPAPQP